MCLTGMCKKCFPIFSQPPAHHPRIIGKIAVPPRGPARTGARRITGRLPLAPEMPRVEIHKLFSTNAGKNFANIPVDRLPPPLGILKFAKQPEVLPKLNRPRGRMRPDMAVLLGPKPAFPPVGGAVAGTSGPVSGPVTSPSSATSGLPEFRSAVTGSRFCGPAVAQWQPA